MVTLRHGAGAEADRDRPDGPPHGTPAVMLIAVLLCFGPVADAGAQQPTTQGLVVGLDFGGNVTSFENQPRDTGGLVGARVGYGLNKAFTPYLGIYEVDTDTPEFGAFDKMTFGHVDLGVRLHLPGGSNRWVPLGDLALTFWPVSDVLKNGERTAGDFSGAALSLGGGLSIYVTDAWAVDLNAKWGKGEFRNAPVGSAGGGLDRLDINAASARFTVGFSWWP